MSEQTDTQHDTQNDTIPTAARTRHNKIGAMRAAPVRGRKPKHAVATIAAFDPQPKRRGRPRKDLSAATAEAAQPKRSLAHARLIERIDALVQEHDVKRIGKLLDAVQGLR